MKNGVSPNFRISLANLRLRFCTVIILMTWVLAAYAQNQTAKETSNGIFYYEYLPPDYNSNTNNYPIVFFLHGLGERGDAITNLPNVAKNGPPKHVKNGYKFPFILISPQLKTKYTGWPNAYIDQVIEYCKSYLRIDPTRMYLTGLSLGGGGVWTYSQEVLWGQQFAAVAPICGSTNNVNKACSYGLTNLPVWAFHGDADGTVSIGKTRRMVEAINACSPAPNPLAKFTIYPGVGHNSWDNAYRTDNALHTPNLYEWMLQFRNRGLFVFAGGDRSFNLPTNSTTINATVTIETGTITSYQWTKMKGPPGAVITNASTPNVSITNMVKGSYVMRLTVVASTGETTYDEIKIEVGDGNSPPVADAGSDISLTLPTNAINITGKGTDANGSVASYAWTKVSGPGASMNGTTTTTLALTNLVVGTYVFSFTVTDNEGATATDLVNVIVSPAAANQLPTANAGADRTVNLPTSAITLTGAGSDPDGTITTYLWEKVNGPAMTIGGTSSASLSLSNLVAGVYTFRLTVTDNSSGKDSDDVTVTVIAANQSPVANAGNDITITLPTNSTNLEGSASDPDGSIASYEWISVSGPGTPTILNGATATPSLSALTEGTYVFRLTVTDDKGSTDFDEVNVIVKAGVVNSPPVADAGGDQTINLPTNSVTLNGSGSDADGTITTYAWSKTSGPSVTMTNTNLPVLTLDDLLPGIYEFELTVTDNQGATNSSLATITVLNTNQSPVANAGADIVLTLPTNTTNISGSGSDPDGTVTAYEWSQVSGPNVATLVNATTSTLSANDLAVGIYIFSLTVTDDDGTTGSDEVQVTVNAVVANETPLASAGADKSITLPANSVTLEGNGTDNDGTIATFAWILLNGPTCIMTGENTPTLDVTFMIPGSYTFRLTVTDDDGASHEDDVNVTVQPETVNQSPVADAGADANLSLPTNTISISGNASDADGTVDSYLWEKISGPAATLAGTATATLELADLVEGTYVFQLTVTDNLGATGTDIVSVFVNSGNQLPIANAGNDITLSLPANTTPVDGSGSDIDGTITSYAWIQISGPSTATLSNEATEVLTVADLVEGSYVFKLTVTDNNGGTAEDEMKVIVNAANQAPLAAAGSDRTITLPTNQSTFNGSGTDADGTIASYTWTQISGPSATLSNENTNALSVTVTTSGTYVFRLTVTDNLGAIADDDVRLIVNEETVNQPPVANAGPNKNLTLPINTVSLSGNGSDPDGTVASYQWTIASGPTALLLNANTPNLSVRNMLEGTYVFRLTVTDNEGATATDEASVTVAPQIINQVPVANAGTNKSITLPTNTMNLTGSGSDPDGTIAAYLWTKVSGPDVTITNGSSAVVSLADLLEGNYVFRLTVTDDDGATSTDDVAVTVNAAIVNQAPTANAGPNRSITLPQNTLTITGTASDADGSVASYQWHKISGPTPSMAGTMSPTLELSNLVEGTYVFRLTVTDNEGLSTQDNMQLVVLPASVNQIPVANAGPNESITLPLNSITLFGSGSDADGGIITYQWSVISGTPVTLANETTPTVSLTDLVAGNYILRLTVTDDVGATDTDDVLIVVNPETTNQLPVANAGSNQTISLPTTIATLTGSGSDNDGTIVSYNWLKVSGPSVTLGATNLSSLALSNLVEGVYVFRLTVEDNAGATDTDNVSVTVLPETTNAAPVVDAGNNITLLEPASTANLDGNASDTDGTITLIAWTQVQGPVVTITNPNSFFAQVSGLTVGTYRFRLTVTDDESATAFDDVIVTVNPVNTNQAPVANAGANQTIKLPLNAITLNGSGTDTDGTIASFTWLKLSGPAGTINGENTADLALTNLNSGTYQFQLIVADDDGASHSDFVTVTVLPEDQNEAPSVNAGADVYLELPENAVTLTGTASDDDAVTDILWEKVSGPAVTMNGSTTLSLELTDLLEGYYTFRLTVSDAEGVTNADEVTVNVFPEIVIPENPVVDAGEDIHVQLPQTEVLIVAEAESAEGLIVNYTWQQLAGPPVIFNRTDTAVAVISNPLPGTYSFVITVTDAGGRTASDEVNIIVLEEIQRVTAHNLFSPDNKGDVATETWIIENSDMLDGCEITVYNRQGQKVYQSIGYPIPWDGTFGNKPVPDGAYFYIITCNGQKTQSGSVTIARLK
ncbi:MAG TPA: PKD domain-containing protein [Ohtaekwangia sp.]|nr:PKD domain-containing protein [Ohtaekwangia sp.]